MNIFKNIFLYLTNNVGRYSMNRQILTIKNCRDEQEEQTCMSNYYFIVNRLWDIRKNII